MAEMLQGFDNHAETKHGINRISIHPKLVSFIKEQERVNWSSTFEDCAFADLYWNFEVALKKRNSRTHDILNRVALFKTLATNWIQDKHYHQTLWHVWAVAIVKGLYGGMYLFIYDCDADLDKAKTMKLDDLGPMLKFYKAIRQKYKLQKVFMGNIHDDFVDSSLDHTAEDTGLSKLHLNENHCTGHTIRWIHTMSWMEDQPYQHDDINLGINNPRWKSFVELKALPMDKITRRN
jgi:hypothetical protein